MCNICLMVFIMDVRQSKFILDRLDEGIPEDHVSRLVVRFVDEFYPILGIEEKDGKMGRPNFPLCEMFKLVIYAYYCGVTSPKVIEDQTMFHKVYIYVSSGIKPSERTIRRFISEYGYLFNNLLGCTLIFAGEAGMTDFEHISVDGTIQKANNSKFNVIHENNIKKLIKHYTGFKLPYEEIKKLPRPVRKIIDREDMSDDDKLNLLFELETQITMSGQNTVPVNDVEARWMHNKEGNSQISYNVQTAVDTISKLICSVKVSQNPTDHYELPKIVENAIINIEEYPDYVSADTGYHNEVSFEYLKQNNIEGLIPDRKQTRENTKRLSENPYHKDNFEYNAEKDTFICPNNQELKFKYEYRYSSHHEDHPDKIERKYINYEACKNCKQLQKCTKGSHRIISEFASPYALETKNKMNTEEYKEKFKKRSSTVEAPFGTLKVYYHINELPTNGIKHTEHILSLCSITYNLKRIYNIIKDTYEPTDNINLFKEKIEGLFNLKCKLTTQ